MAYEDIIYKERDNTAYITFNRPERMNAFRMETYFEVLEALQDAGWNSDIGSIVLTGAGGKAFCTGGDQVGNRVEKLAVREPGQLDSRRVVTRLCLGRIKRFEDISRHEFSIVADALFRVILRHGACDDAGQFFDRPITNERLVVFIGHALTLVAVALGTMVGVNQFARQCRLGQGGRLREQGHSQ